LLSLLLLLTTPLLSPPLSSQKFNDTQNTTLQARHLQSHRKGNWHTQCLAKSPCHAKHHSLSQYCSPSLSEVPHYVHTHNCRDKNNSKTVKCITCHQVFNEKCTACKTAMSNVLSTVNQAHYFFYHVFL
jgi:hypothetical protein